MEPFEMRRSKGGDYVALNKDEAVDPRLHWFCSDCNEKAVKGGQNRGQISVIPTKRLLYA